MLFIVALSILTGIFVFMQTFFDYPSIFTGISIRILSLISKNYYFVYSCLSPCFNMPLISFENVLFAIGNDLLKFRTIIIFYPFIKSSFFLLVVSSAIYYSTVLSLYMISGEFGLFARVIFIIF